MGNILVIWDILVIYSGIFQGTFKKQTNSVSPGAQKVLIHSLSTKGLMVEIDKGGQIIDKNFFLAVRGRCFNFWQPVKNAQNQI